MASALAKRKQKVNELRKAHFPFGFDDNSNAQSQYRKHYNEHPIQMENPIGDRRSHFTISSDEPAMARNTYQSQFKEKYPQHPLQPVEAVKSKNEQNNIVFGFGDAGKQTNYKDDYPEKRIEAAKPVNQREVHVDLGDSLTDFTSSYNRAYEGGQGGRPDMVNANTRASNLTLGYDGNSYQTSQGASHNTKPVQPFKHIGRSYGDNIVLGDNQNGYDLQSKSQYRNKPANYEPVDKQRVLDFRAAHFQLGFPQDQVPNYSEAQAQYAEKPLTIVETQGRKPTNIELKHDSNNYFQSTYGDNFHEKQGERAEVKNSDARASNVIIGMGANNYESEARGQYNAKSVPVVKGKGAPGGLRVGEGEVDYSTQYGQTFTNKHGIEERHKVTREDVVKQRMQNYVNGFSGVDYKLHSQGYGKVAGESNRLPRQVVDKMRGTNIVNSDENAFYGSTTHKAAYGWKKNNDL